MSILSLDSPNLRQYQYRSILNKYGIKLVVVGNRGMLPDRVKAAAEKAEGMTRHNERYVKPLLNPVP